MIKTIQFNNMNLVRKINSAFIVTLPVFKQALAQAILMKRQSLQSDALSALERRTGELMRRNAQGAADQARASARAAGTDTLESARQTILEGIDDTRRLQADARSQREQDQARLEALRRDFNARHTAGRQGEV